LSQPKSKTFLGNGRVIISSQNIEIFDLFVKRFFNKLLAGRFTKHVEKKSFYLNVTYSRFFVQEKKTVPPALHTT
jgi:hypothetical protein